MKTYKLTEYLQAIRITDITNSNFAFIRGMKTLIPEVDIESNHFICFPRVLNLEEIDFFQMFDSGME